MCDDFRTIMDLFLRDLATWYRDWRDEQLDLYKGVIIFLDTSG